MFDSSPIEQRAEQLATAAEPVPLDIFRQLGAPVLEPEDFPHVVARLAVIARGAGHDPAAYMFSALAVAAGAIADDVRVLLDSRSSWFESPRLWALLLGLSSAAKTPALTTAVAPLWRLHGQKRAEHAKLVEGLPKDEPRPPKPCLIVNDATTEALSEVLAANPRGVLSVHGELDSWLGSHDAYRGGLGSKDRGDWLQLYDGGPRQINRVTRGDFYVPNWGCSLLGATTPDGLQRHAKSLPADGLIQRFLPCVVRPMMAPEPVLIAESKAASEAFAQRIVELHELRPGVVRLSREAADAFQRRRDELRAEVQAFEQFSEPFAAHLGKHPGLLGRVAVTMHCLEHGPGAIDAPISGDTMDRTVRLLRKLMRHALAMFDILGAGNNGALELARKLARSILASELHTASKNTLVQSCNAFRAAHESLQRAAITVLEDAGWLIPDGDGRTYRGLPTAWKVPASVHTTFAKQAQRHRELRREVLTRIAESANG